MRPSQTFQKRQRERARQEKQREKLARKQQRKQDKTDGTEPSSLEVSQEQRWQGDDDEASPAGPHSSDEPGV